MRGLRAVRSHVLRCTLVLGLLLSPSLAAAAQRLLLIPPVEPELASRLDGYVRGSEWSLEVAAIGPDAPSQRVVPRAALTRGQGVRAAVVVWFEWTEGTALRVHLLDVERELIIVRDIPLSGEEQSLAKSAAYETAALIVASTLERIDAGAEVGEKLEATPAAAPAASSASTPPATAPAPNVQSGSSVVLEAGWRAAVDAERVRHGPRIAAGARFDRWLLSADGVWLLDSSLVSATEDGADEVRLSLSETLLGASVGYALWPRGGFALDVALNGSLLVAKRRTLAASGTLVASPAKTDLLPQVTALLRATTGVLADSGVVLGGEVGVTLVPLRPRWLLEHPDAGRTALDAQWNAVQPTVGMWLSWGSD